MIILAHKKKFRNRCSTAREIEVVSFKVRKNTKNTVSLVQSLYEPLLISAPAELVAIEFGHYSSSTHAT